MPGAPQIGNWTYTRVRVERAWKSGFSQKTEASPVISTERILHHELLCTKWLPKELKRDFLSISEAKTAESSCYTRVVDTKRRVWNYWDQKVWELRRGLRRSLVPDLAPRVGPDPRGGASLAEV